MDRSSDDLRLAVTCAAQPLPTAGALAVSWDAGCTTGPGTMKKTTPHALIFLCIGLWLPAPAAAKQYRLDEILDLARKGNPGLAAGVQATAGVEAQLLGARRGWMPSGEINSL